MEYTVEDIITEAVPYNQHAVKSSLKRQCYSKINQTKDIVDYVSNFDDIHDRFFWKVISTEVLQVIYHRKAVLYNEWDQLVGPLTFSNYDKLSFQFMCMKRKIRIVGTEI